MDTTILVTTGLTEAQASAYLILMANSPIAPPKLAGLIDETRTNTYKILEQLEALGLAQKDESSKKIHYWANNPSALRQLAEKQKETAELQFKKIEAALPELQKKFLEHNDQPGVKFYQGKEAIMQIYEDQIKTGSPVQFIRSTSDVLAYSYTDMRKTRGKFAKSGISRHVFSPDAPDVPIEWERIDPPRRLTRTWIDENSYTAPVEWDVYGDKLSIISFGEETVGTVIESKQIADAFRQILVMLDKGLRSLPGYEQLPKNAAAVIDNNIDIE